jgi:hypothetical protein
MQGKKNSDVQPPNRSRTALLQPLGKYLCASGSTTVSLLFCNHSGYYTFESPITFATQNMFFQLWHGGKDLQKSELREWGKGEEKAEPSHSGDILDRPSGLLRISPYQTG